MKVDALGLAAMSVGGVSNNCMTSRVMGEFSHVSCWSKKAAAGHGSVGVGDVDLGGVVGGGCGVWSGGCESTKI